MDVPKSSFNLLKSFPPDIWAYFGFYLPIEQFGRLKITGSTSLWSKLILPKVIKSVNLGKDLIRFKSWPAFLNEFPSIEELSIDSPCEDWWLDLGLNLSNVPSTVRKLRIGGLLKDFDRFFLCEGRRLNVADQLPHLEALDLNTGPFLLTDMSTNWTIHFPPTLTHLRLYEWDETLEFPPSLTLLSLQRPALAAKVPSKLESYRFVSLGAPESNFYWPSSLMSLTIIGSLGFGSEQIAIIPRTLTELDMILQKLPTSLWSSLPPCLKKLVFWTGESNYVPVTVIDPLSGKTYEAQTFPLELLPKSLSYLHLYTSSLHPLIPSETISSSSSSYFPPTLTTLIAFNHQLSPNSAKLLPSSLTLLKIGNLCERISEYLPKSLTFLESQTTLLTPKLIELLPKSLATLGLNCAREVDHWFDFNTGLELSSLADLENFSSHKQYASTLDWNDLSLPPNITTLELGNFQDFGDSSTPHHKLPNLMRLGYAGLLGAMHFTDHSIPLLNRHLTSLSFPSSKEITGKSFPNLPRNLTLLNLCGSSSIFDNDIQHLPSSLTVAYLSLAVHLTDESIPHFPRHLIELDLSSNETITEACFPNLPYPLKLSTETFVLKYLMNRKGEMWSELWEDEYQ